MIEVLDTPPIATGAGAIYPYSEALHSKLFRTTKFDDPYNMGRVVGAGLNKRLWAPRAMAPTLGNDIRSDGVPFKFHSKFKPRDAEQARIIKECVALLKAGKNFMVSAPTGVGKTWMSTDIIANIGKKTLVVVTKEDVQFQWAMALYKCLGLGQYRTWVSKDLQTGEDHLEEEVLPGNGLGLIKADKVITQGCGVVIAYVQSIAKFERYPVEMFKEFGFVIWDECHRVGADFFSQSAYNVPAKLRMGVSATTQRPDGKTEVIEAHIGPVMVSSEMMAEKARVYWNPSPWKCPQVLGKDDHGNTALVKLPHSPTQCMHVVKMLAGHHKRNAMLCNFIGQAYQRDRQIMVQSDILDHLDKLGAMLPQFGIPSKHVARYVGGMTEGERRAAKKSPVILCTYKMTSEATDIPSADTLVMATPKAHVAQIVGRILRFHEEKKEPYVFDLVDFDSPLFEGYWYTRKKWYESKGFEVKQP